jgi:hypothetical protein
MLVIPMNRTYARSGWSTPEVPLNIVMMTGHPRLRESNNLGETLATTLNLSITLKIRTNRWRRLIEPNHVHACRDLIECQDRIEKRKT